MTNVLLNYLNMGMKFYDCATKYVCYILTTPGVKSELSCLVKLLPASVRDMLCSKGVKVVMSLSSAGVKEQSFLIGRNNTTTVEEKIKMRCRSIVTQFLI